VHAVLPPGCDRGVLGRNRGAAVPSTTIDGPKSFSPVNYHLVMIPVIGHTSLWLRPQRDEVRA
jgi:hypothetical protein